MHIKFNLGVLVTFQSANIEICTSGNALGILICGVGAVCSIEESSGPKNLRVSIVIKASKSAGVKGNVLKIYGFVHPLHPF